MKKKFLTAAILLFIFLNSYSQVGKDKGYFALTIGPSFPIGNYAKSDVTNSMLGLAKMGDVVNISYSCLTGKNFGIAATLLGQINPLNIHSMEQSFAQLKLKIASGFVTEPGQPLPNTPGNTYPNWQFEKHSWKLAAVLFGGYGQLPSGNSGKISFITKAMIGIMYAVAPKLKGSSITDTAGAYIEQSSGSAVGFSFLLSGGIKYQLNNKISLLSNLDFLGTGNLTFKNIKATVTTTKGTTGSLNYSIQQSIATGNTKQKISSLNLNFGVAFKFNE
jgi:hypothetical protein